MANEIVKSPLAGKISLVKVKKGDLVKKGDTICIIEALKMEVQIKTPVEGTLEEIHVVEQQKVKIGDVVAVILKNT